MIVHLVDGTYELFRHFYGLRRFTKGKDRPYGAVVGVLQTVLQIIETSHVSESFYVGVATDHVIESFRNRLFPGYKTGAGIEPALLAQFHPLEEALAAMGVVVWPTIELEADDALASAAHLAAKDKKVKRVAIWTPDKDLAQCVRGTRVVTVCRARTLQRWRKPTLRLDGDTLGREAGHRSRELRREAATSPSRLSQSREAGASVLGKSEIDGRRKTIRDASAVREKFGVSPQLIPDLLALVGDAADGYPGIPGIGTRTAAQLLNRYGRIEKFPSNVLGKQRKLALLFKKLATLRTDAPLFKKVETLRWRGPTPEFAKWAKRMKAPRLLERIQEVTSDM